MPVWISRSGKCPWRTIRRRPAESVRCAYASTKSATSASTACPSKRRAPRRKTSVSGSSSNDPGWRSWTTVSSLMAYPSFVENGDSNIARVRRPHLISSPTFGYSSLVARETRLGTTDPGAASTRPLAPQRAAGGFGDGGGDLVRDGLDLGLGEGAVGGFDVGVMAIDFLPAGSFLRPISIESLAPSSQPDDPSGARRYRAAAPAD